jgi:two-component system, NarL family, sensor histidine kinase DesK
MMLITELREARADLARLAVTEERLRFARDLHDLLGHSLTTISLKSQVARRLAEPDSRVAREVGDIESVTQQALAEVRDAVTGYRDRSLADELATARSTLTAAGVEVTVRTHGTPLPARVDTLLGWVVREGTTNVVRHSRATTCEFDLTHDGTTVSLAVRDDGIGAPPSGQRGNGLAGLAERVAAAGGRLVCGPAADRGFRLAARLPLDIVNPGADS